MASRKVRSMEFMCNIRGILEATPDRSFRSIAKEQNVSHATIISCVNEDLQCKSYRMQNGQFLSEAMKARGAVKLLNKLQYPKDPGMLWFFSDKKNFCQNQRNNVPRVMKTKFPATVMVFGVVLSSNVNDFETKRNEPLILAIFFISKRNEPCLFQNF
jgi:hypothetical protein